jgi:hypothetical protein
MIPEHIDTKRASTTALINYAVPLRLGDAAFNSVSFELFLCGRSNQNQKRILHQPNMGKPADSDSFNHYFLDLHGKTVVATIYSSAMWR